MKECRSDELQREKCFKAKPQKLVHIRVPSFVISTFFIKLVVPQMLNDAFKLLQA